MAEERIELSAQERERLKVLHEITQGHLRQIEAAHRLRLSDRQGRRLLQRLGAVGGRGAVHGLRGLPRIERFPPRSSSAACAGCGCQRMAVSVRRWPPNIWRG